MHTMIGPTVQTYDRRSPASVDVRELVDEFIDRTVALSRDLPRGERPIEIRRLETDFTRRGEPTLSRWLRIALAAVQRGQDARLYGELVADLLGAAVATVLPVRDASLAETLAECAANPLQEIANGPNATPDDLERAARAIDVEVREAQALARSYRRRRRELLRREGVA